MDRSAKLMQNPIRQQTQDAECRQDRKLKKRTAGQETEKKN